MQRKIQINRKGIKNRTSNEKDSKSMTIIISIIYKAIFTPNLFSAILTRYAANIFEPGNFYER
jgi:hypothetical protein